MTMLRFRNTSNRSCLDVISRRFQCFVELSKQSLLKQAVERNEAEAPEGITLTQSARTRFGGDSVERPTREGLGKVFAQFRLCD
jgi:hypothetical protein